MGKQNLPSDSDPFLSYADPLSPDSSSPEYMALRLLWNFIRDLDLEHVRISIEIFFQYWKSILKFFKYLLKEILGLPIYVDIIMYKEIIGDLDIVRDTMIVGDVTIKGNLHVMPHADLHVMPHADLHVVLN